MYQLISSAPPFIAAILGGFTVFVCLFWAVRRAEMAFGWLALIGATLLALTATATAAYLHWLPVFLLPVAFLGFVVSFARLSWASGPLELMKSVLLFLRQGTPGETRWHGPAIAVTFVVALTATAHDWVREAGWANGLSFSVLPYSGLAVFSVLAFLLAQRVLDALSVVENLNQILESKMRAANASLAASEAARRALEVSGAIIKERDRLMREIHDGIGSSLVTSIAAAERQGAAVDGTSLLRRALTDLRIAVDSLEPMQGDLATLLASLRYRVEPDMRKAGVTFDWQVQEVPEADWLDAVNALHVLRIFQEAFSNILGHSEATRVVVRCHPEIRNSETGVLIEVSDNGKGFGDKGGPKGHGLKNMASRAEALGGILTHSSAPGQGTSVILWLPAESRQKT